MNKDNYFNQFILLFAALIFGCASVPKSVPEYAKSPVGNSSNKIILLGDTQRTLWIELWCEQNDDIRERIFPQILSHNPSTVVILGDLVSWGASEDEWEYFDRISKPIREAKTQVLNVMGNHEYFGSNSSTFRHVSSRFPLMRNAISSGKTWYCSIVDSVAFLILDSNTGELSEEQINQQKNWLDSTVIALNNTPGILNIILCTHHPAYTNSRVVRAEPDVQEFIRSALSHSDKITLAASGHAHAYEHFLFDSTLNVIVSGGGGGPRQELNSVKKSVYHDLYNDGKTKDDQRKTRNFNYCTIERNHDTLDITMMQFDESTKSWIQGDKFTATKSRKQSQSLLHKTQPMKTTIYSPDAPAPIGPYSQGIKAQGSLLFLSGQIALLQDGTIALGDVKDQTRQVITNISTLLKEAGCTVDNVVKTTVFLKNMSDFAAMNLVYSEFFGESKPARSTVEVSRLPKDVLVEIEVIAVCD